MGVGGFTLETLINATDEFDDGMIAPPKFDWPSGIRNPATRGGLSSATLILRVCVACVAEISGAGSDAGLSLAAGARSALPIIAISLAAVGTTGWVAGTCVDGTSAGIAAAGAAFVGDDAVAAAAGSANQPRLAAYQAPPDNSANTTTAEAT